MKIGINGDEANVVNPVGIGQFALNVIRELEIQDKSNSYVCYLTSKVNANLPRERNNWKYRLIWPSKFSTQFALPLNLVLNREKIDVFFTPTHYAPRICPMPSVVSIMDLSFLMFPEYFSRKDLWQLVSWTKYSVKNAARIITISENSRLDIAKFYGVDPARIHVCYPGYDPVFHTSETNLENIEKVKKEYSLNKKYLMAVGTLQPRKNYDFLLRVFSRLRTKIDLKLVIVGKKGWLYDSIFDLVKNLHLEDDVVFTDYLSTAKMVLLLQGAEIYVMASLYEGFGIPVIEAQACGTPVVVSRVSSLPEVVGDSGLLFDPQDEKDLLQQIEKMLENSDLRLKFREKGLKNVSRFSWQKCAENVLKSIMKAY